MNAMLKYLNYVVNVTLIDSFTTIDIKCIESSPNNSKRRRKLSNNELTR